ncbi:amino acid permease [bacterium]|nr:amino acid permease [bacterium]
MRSNKPELRRAIALPHATAMVVGTIIGSAIFVQPSIITSLVPSVTGTIMVWLASGVLTLFGALVCAELASIFTRSGGVYLYLKESFSPALGFLWGWAMFWVMHSGIIAAVAVIFARYLTYFFPQGDIGVKAIAIACIVILSGVNYLGVKPGSSLQTLMTFGKLLAIVLIIIFGFFLGSSLPEHFVSNNQAETDISVKNFLLAMIAGLFAFGGWHMVTYNSEETIQPRKTIPKALVIGSIVVTSCYIAMSVVYMYILPLETVASSRRIAADAADAVLGFGGGGLMAGLVVFSTFGALTGIILSGPRVYYAMAQDGLLFQWLGSIHPKHRTPAIAIAVQAVWSSALVATGTYRELFTRVIYTEWIFFALMAGGLFVLRKRPDIERDYHIWGYPVLPALFIIFSAVIVLNQIITNPSESLVGLSIVLIGLPVYFFWARDGRKRV